MIHDYLRSIGFYGLDDNQKLYQLLEKIVKNPDDHQIVSDTYGNQFGCFSKAFGKNMGITVCGNFYNEQEFHIDYYFPYLCGSTSTVYPQMEVEKYTFREGYAGICDEMRLGVTLIFHVNNIADILHSKYAYGNEFAAANVVLSGLATSGKILLPVMKTDVQLKRQEEVSRKRINLLQKAKEGKQTAIDSLTLEDMDTYSMLSRRVNQNKEDILSIVESSFMPYGVESEQYVVIGEIVGCFVQLNHLTGEVVWIITLNCSGMQFDIAINEKDLYGEPKIGRRFRGRVLMQGIITV